jgi:Rieske Fe-S protein
VVLYGSFSLSSECLSFAIWRFYTCRHRELLIFITATIVTDRVTPRCEAVSATDGISRSIRRPPPHFYLTPRLFLAYYSTFMEPGRREFIKNALAWVLALLGLGFLLPGLRILSPAARHEKELVYFPLVDEGEVPRSGVKKAELSFTATGKERKTRVFIVSSPEGLAVFSAVCSHLGCLVNYRKEKREFVCPCHGGRYDLSGKNIAGPPPAPLTQFPAKVEKGMVMVGVKV